MRKGTSLYVTVAAIVGLLSMPAHSDAGLTGGVCTGGKLKTTGKKAKAKLVCHKKAANKGEMTDPGCLTTAEDHFNAGFGHAEDKPPCYATGDAGAIEIKVDNFVADMVTQLRPVLTESKCAAGELNATGKKAAAKLTCHQKAAKKGLKVDPACLTKAEGKFTKSFATAVGKSDCVSGTSAATIEAAVDAFVADVADDLRPGPMSACSGNKLRDAGQKQEAKLKCHADGAKAGGSTDASCLSVAEAKFAAGFTDDEVSADCLAPTGDVTAIEMLVDQFVSDVESQLRPNLNASGCAAKKLTETANTASQKVLCRARSVKHGLPQSTTCPDPADVNFAKADTGADCISTGDEAVIEGYIDNFVSDLYTALVP